MTRKTTQKETVEHLLRARGQTGIHTFELRKMFIGNPSERVRQLREHGWLIDAVDCRFKGEAFGTRYRLISEPEVERDAGSSKPPFGDGTHPPADVSLSPGDGYGGDPGRALPVAAPGRLFDLPSEPHYSPRAA